MSDDVCQKCGHVLRVSDFPFCPHGSTTTSVITDDVPGGFWAENGFSEPTKFYSKSEHAAALAARGCEIRAKWAGPNDKHLSRWDAVSADQLAKATELVSRQKAPALNNADVDNTTLHVEHTVTVLPETFRVGVEA